MVGGVLKRARENEVGKIEQQNRASKGFEDLKAGHTRFGQSSTFILARKAFYHAFQHQ